MILERKDAKLEIQLTDEENDVLNEVLFNPLIQ
jgi:hypothetical protein